MFRIATLGTTSIARADGTIVSLDAQQPKRLALIAYLAAARPRGPQRRDALVALLWPELDESRARAALRQALHAIRRTLASDAIISRGLEALELSREHFGCDVWQLDEAIEAGDHSRVLELYNGDFLAGLHVSDAPEFERWVDAERAELRRIATHSAWAVAAGCIETRAPDVVHRVRAAVSLSGVDEGALRKGMRMLAEVGDRASAISLYERFAAALRRDLDVDVDQETRALARELRDFDGEPPVTAASFAQAQARSPIDEHAAPTSIVARAKHLTRRRRAVLGVAAGVAALIFAARHSSAADAALDPRRVDVSPFVNETGNAALDAVARQLTLDARSALTRIEGAVLTAGIGTGGTRVQGVLRVEGDSLVVRAEVIDVGSGSVVRTLSSPRSSATVLPHGFASFTDRLSAAVATALYPGWGNALSEPRSFDAYRLFLAGMRDIKLERHDRAIEAFRQAFSQDSSFTAAGLLAAMELYQVRRFAAADSLASAIERRRNTLRPIDTHLLDWIARSLRGDRFGARAAMQAVVTLAPTADLAWLQLAIDNVETARPEDALAALDRIDPSAEFGEGWTSFWATRIEALHVMGEHSRELAVAREGLNRHPELRILVNYEVRALAALGRVDELNTRLHTVPGASDSSTAALESTVRQVAQELRAHGFAGASQKLLDRLKTTFTQPESGRPSTSDPMSAARTYYLAGDNARAATVYDSVYRAHPKCLDCAGLLGVIAARRGDHAAADRYAQTLTAADRMVPYFFGRTVLWRARIANSLGDRHLASILLASAFANGLEFDVMTHADPDLQGIRPDSIYRAFAAVR